MLSLNPLVGGPIQLKYQSNIKTQQQAADANVAPLVKKPAAANTDAVAQAKPVASAVDAFSIAPRVDTPNLFAGSLQEIFNNFDSDKNGLVTKSEIETILKSANASDKDIDAFVKNVLSDVNDTNGDGLSMTELKRVFEMTKDAFAAYDLNSDGKIENAELEDAIKRFTAAGWKVDADNVRQIFADADLDSSKVLTKAEFDNFNKYGKASAESRAFEVMFHNFDTNSDGKVTRDELLASLQKDGMAEKDAMAFADNIFSITSDVDGDGAMSISELRRRIAADKGDTFAMADLNNSGEVTAEEFEEAIALYQKNGNKFDADFARRAFASVDSDGNGILSRAEFDIANNAASDVTVAAKPAPVEPVDAIAVKPQPVADVAAADISAPKPEVPKISPAMIDAQLFLMLQESQG